MREIFGSEYITLNGDSVAAALYKTIYYMVTPSYFLACDTFSPMRKSRFGFQNVVGYLIPCR